MIVVAVLAGMLLGAWMGEGFGAVAGALIGWLLLRLHLQERRLAALEAMLKAPAPAAAPGVAVAPPATAAPTPTAAPTMPAPPIAAAAPHPAPPPPPATPPRDWLAPAKRWLFGGNTIVKAGVGILFIGLAFLARYASEHVQVPVELRLAGIGSVALVLLALGWRLRGTRAAYAQALQGGAVAVLYLTLFVAFKWYGLLAGLPVFVLMVAVAALAAALAVLQNARALAVIGALGGFATPLLVSTGSGNHVALFSYYLVLDLGIAAVAWFRTWRVLNAVGFGFTFGVATLWGVLSYEPAHYASAQAFLIVFFVLFNAVLLLPARRAEASRADGWVNGSLLFGLPTIAFALQLGLVHTDEYGAALSALALAAFYVAVALFMRGRARLAVTFDASLGIAIVFITLVIPFALDARSTVGAWALEGAGLVWLGWRQGRWLPRAFGYALLALSALAMLHVLDTQGAPATPWNAQCFSALMGAAASLAAARFVARAAPAHAERWAEPVLIGAATLWLLAAMFVQVDAFVPHQSQRAALMAGMTVIAALFLAAALRWDWARAAYPALGHAPALLLGVLATAVDGASPAAAGGIWAWPLALAMHALLLARGAPFWPALPAQAVHGLGVVVLAGLGALQGRAITGGWGDDASAWAWLGWGAVPALLLAALLRPATVQRWPVRLAPAAYTQAAAGVLAGGLLLWTLLANAASDGAARPLPFVPLVNPLDIGIAAALLAAWAWLRGPALAAWPQAPAVLVGGAGFVWLNAMLVRAFHHWGGVPLRVQAWTQSLPVQTGLTLLWTSTALVLMWLAARRAARLPWMVGAALLAAVVLKLLLVDLSGSGTVTRIVSFIGVGVLMLVIGYVAPLPSNAAKGAARAPL